MSFFHDPKQLARNILSTIIYRQMITNFHLDSWSLVQVRERGHSPAHTGWFNAENVNLSFIYLFIFTAIAYQNGMLCLK